MPQAHEKRIAVIAVHGVADQKPGDSQAAIAALLLSSTDANRQPLYEPFASRTISVPLEPAYAKAAAADITRAAYEAGEFEQRPSIIRSLTGGSSRSAARSSRILWVFRDSSGADLVPHDCGLPSPAYEQPDVHVSRITMRESCGREGRRRSQIQIASISDVGFSRPSISFR